MKISKKIIALTLTFLAFININIQSLAQSMEGCKGSGEKCEVTIEYTDNEGEDQVLKVSSVKNPRSAAVTIQIK